MDNYEIETFMRMNLETQLLEDEKIKWCGVTENDAKPWEYSETKSTLIIMGICTLLGVLFTGATIKDIIAGSFDNVFGGLLVGLILLGTAGFFFYRYFFQRKIRYYAVTNYRVYILDENGNIVCSQRMKSDYKIRYYKSSRSIGWVEVYKKEKKIDIDDAYERYYNKEIVTFRGIKDLEKAYHCIYKLIIESANITDNRSDFSNSLFNI